MFRSTLKQCGQLLQKTKLYPSYLFSICQVITGTKTLTNQNGMDVTNSAYLQGDVHSRGPVGGIRIEDLSMVVTEHGSQVIAGKKSLVNVHVTGNVLVQGNYNAFLSKLRYGIPLTELKQRLVYSLQ